MKDKKGGQRRKEDKQRGKRKGNEVREKGRESKGGKKR